MAQRTVIELVDDLTGEAIPDGEGKTVAFTFQGVSYEIDLSDDSIAELTTRSAPTSRADAVLVVAPAVAASLLWRKLCRSTPRPSGPGPMPTASKCPAVDGWPPT